MRLTTRIQKAIDKAAQLHDGQRRKADDLPYIVHPMTVAATLLPLTDDEDVVVAALLHDIIEDVPGYSVADIQRDFGPRVVELVLEVTEDGNRPGMSDADERATWEERKAGYLKTLGEDCVEALMISAADKLHNLRSLIIAVERDGAEQVAHRFNATLERKLWYYGEIIKVMRERLGGPLTSDLEVELKRAQEVIL
jgi:(p)ppGpp synthase/HD superfamily hydrolase